MDNTTNNVINRIAIVQINLRNTRAANPNLTDFVIKNRIDIALVQDIFKINNDNSTIPGVPGDWQRYFSTQKTAGVLICNKNLLTVEVSRNENSVIVSVLTDDKNILVGSFYSPPSSDFEKDVDDWCVSLCDKDFIIGGDFNAHNRLWGHSRNDQRGDYILDICNIYDFVIQNNPNDHPTYHESGRYGCPDLTLSTINIDSTITNWRVDLTDSLSDHRFICFNINLNPIINHKTVYKTNHYSITTLDNQIKTHLIPLINIFENSKTSIDFDIAIDKLTEGIITLCNNTFKKSKISRSKIINWWNEALLVQRKKVTALYKKFKRTKDKYDLIKYKKERAIYRKNINDSKRDSWRKFCTTTRDKFGKAFNIIRDKTLDHKALIHIALDGMPIDSDYHQVYDKLINFHFSIVDSPVFENLTLSNLGNNSINFAELKEAINSQANKKAPGSDNIGPSIIKIIFNRCPNLLLTIYNSLLNYSYFPTSWKFANVIFFCKKGKPAESPRSYRPVCLLQSLSKVFEKIINYRLTNFLETNRITHDSQFGFREGRSTTQCLKYVINKIVELKKTKKYVIMVAFDFTGAFDYADWKFILEALSRSGVDNYIFNVIKSYLTNRSVGYKKDKEWVHFGVDRGCPQGSCLGPNLWNLIANIILERFDSEDCYVAAFADDFAMIISGNSRQDLEAKANRLVGIFQEVSHKLNLVISESKTIAISFGRDLSRRYPTIKINNKTISFKTEIKYLGVVLDSALHFMPHLIHIGERIHIYNNNINRVSNKYWGITSEMLRVWYITVIEQLLLYAAVIWFPHLTFHGVRRLISIQRQCLVKILKCYKCVSNPVLFLLAGIPPIDIKINTIINKNKIINESQSVYIGHEYISTNEIEKCNIKYNIKTNHFPSNLCWSEASIVIKSGCRLVAFSDGSKTDKGVGLGLVVFHNSKIIFTKMIKLKTDNTVFQAEARAILEILIWFKDTNHREILICSDSLSSVEALRSVYPRSPIILQIHTLCNDMPNRKIHLSWIKAHVGHLGNEIADTLAGDSVELARDSVTIPYPISIINNYIKNQLINNWQFYWDSSEKGMYTKGIISEVDLNIQFKNSILNIFVSGKGSFPTFLHKMGKLETDKCDCGGEGSPLHYLAVKCSFSNLYIKLKPIESLHNYFKRLDNSKYNIDKVKKIYNKLNENFSFIFSKHQ